MATPWKSERNILVSLGVFGAALIVMYGTMIGISVSSVAARESAVQDSRSLTAAVAELEQEYLAKTRAITPEYARSLGYVTAKDRVFVTRETYAMNAQ